MNYSSLPFAPSETQIFTEDLKIEWVAHSTGILNGGVEVEISKVGKHLDSLGEYHNTFILHPNSEVEKALINPPNGKLVTNFSLFVEVMPNQATVVIMGQHRPEDFAEELNVSIHFEKRYQLVAHPTKCTRVTMGEWSFDLFYHGAQLG